MTARKRRLQRLLAEAEDLRKTLRDYLINTNPNWREKVDIGEPHVKPMARTQGRIMLLVTIAVDDADFATIRKLLADETKGFLARKKNLWVSTEILQRDPV